MFILIYMYHNYFKRSKKSALYLCSIRIFYFFILFFDLISEYLIFMLRNLVHYHKKFSSYIVKMLPFISTYLIIPLAFLILIYIYLRFFFLPAQESRHFLRDWKTTTY